MFVTYQSVGLSDVSTEPADIPPCAAANSSPLIWEIDCGRCARIRIRLKPSTPEPLQLPQLELGPCCRTRKRSLTPSAACIPVQSKPSRTRQRQLGHSLGSYIADVAEVSQPDVSGNVRQPAQHQPRQVGTKEGQPRDPNVVGFVPAFILGDVYVCKLPDRQVSWLNPKVKFDVQQSRSYIC